MPAPTVTALPAPPLRSETPATFTNKAESWVAALSGFTTELNALADYLVDLTQADQSTKPFSLGTFMVDNTEARQVLLDYVFTFAGSFPDDFATSQIPPPDASPAATWTASVTLNGTAVGSISVSTGGVVTKTTSAGAVTFAAGSRLRIIGPVVADGSINGLAITLEGTF